MEDKMAVPFIWRFHCSHTHTHTHTHAYLLQLPLLRGEGIEHPTLNDLRQLTPQLPHGQLPGQLKLVLLLPWGPAPILRGGGGGGGATALGTGLPLSQELCRVDVLVERLHVRGTQERAGRLHRQRQGTKVKGQSLKPKCALCAMDTLWRLEGTTRHTQIVSGVLDFLSDLGTIWEFKDQEFKVQMCY